MAGIETYLNLTYELEENLAGEKRRQRDEFFEAQAAEDEQDRRETKTRKSKQQPAAVAHALKSEVAYQFPTRHAQRMGAVQPGSVHGGKNNNRLKAWLEPSNTSFSDKQHQAGSSMRDGPRHYTRHQPLRLTKGSWWDLWMGRLAMLNSSLPIFSPFSTGRKWWELFIMVLVLYNAISVPLDLSFGMPTAGRIVEYLEYAIDLLFAIDICASFRTAYVDEQGHLVRDTDAIAYKYLRTWFAVDLFATIPYDLILEAILHGSMDSTQVLVLKILRTPRLLRLGRLIRIVDRMKSANLIRVVVIVCAMTLISHWLACLWYMMFKFTHFADYLEWGIFVDGAITPDQTLSTYLSAYYQSFLMMVGNNQPSHNNLERVFMILVLIMGACFYSAMVGQMAVLVANMNTVALRHRTKQDTTMDVLRYMGLPDKQMARVQAYFNYITQFSHPAAEGLSFLTDLPKALFDELTGFLYRNHLSKVPLFSDLEPSFMAALAGRMRIVTFTPQETIFRAGDLGLEMYIIRKGYVAVIGKEQQMMGLLSPGDHFGEIAMLTMAKRTARCVALANCDLCVLTTYDLKMVMKDFPASSQALYDKAEEKLLQLQVGGRAGVTDEEYDDDYEDDYEDEEEEEEEEQQEEGGEEYEKVPPPLAQMGRVRRSMDVGAAMPSSSLYKETAGGGQQAVGEGVEEITACTTHVAQELAMMNQDVEITHQQSSVGRQAASAGSVPSTYRIRSSWRSQLQSHSYPQGLQGTAIAEGNEDDSVRPELPTATQQIRNRSSLNYPGGDPTESNGSRNPVSAHRRKSIGVFPTPNGTVDDVQPPQAQAQQWIRNASRKGNHMLVSSRPAQQSGDRSSVETALYHPRTLRPRGMPTSGPRASLLRESLDSHAWAARRTT